MDIVLATRNQHKCDEIAKICETLPVLFETLSTYVDVPTVIEDGQTFEENAIKKAKVIAHFTGKPALADDSGLCVDVLGGAPGIYSARFSGEGASDSQNNQKLLNVLSDYTQKEARSAFFVCVMAVATPDRLVGTVSGECKGYIAWKSEGEHGFGYDPVFWLPEYAKTFGQLGSAVKNKISHRARALVAVKELLHAWL